MVSPIRLLLGAIAIAPCLGAVVGTSQISKRAGIPLLAEVTTEELAAGLDAKLFTSVDLVNVSTSNPEPV